MLSEDLILNKIYIIRNQKVMLDRDLAELYGVETKYLKRQVRRNPLRFPIDFMFELTDKELKIWRSQFVTSKDDKMGLRHRSAQGLCSDSAWFSGFICGKHEMRDGYVAYCY